MNEAELRQRLEEAYFPYAKGFLSTPSQASLDIAFSPGQVVAELKLVPADLQMFEASVDMRREQRRAFNFLSRFLDDTRGPLLTFAAV